VPTPREQLAASLRALRQRAGLTGEQLASQTGLSQPKVSRIETGRSLPNLKEVRAWAQATGASEEELGELAGLLEQLATSATSWRILHRLGLAGKQQEIQELEQQARRITTFQPVMVPGLLQIADYARRVIETAYQPGEVARAVAARLERQSILYDQTKRFDFLITEAALRWWPGPAAMMQAQLDRLISVASLPNVTLAVAPQGEAQIPYLHPFVIWELEEETIVSVETYSAELWVREAADVTRYREVWGRASQGAVGPSRLAEMATELRG
jgi:transcriptional regulator with XRE-family HTH domain